MTTATTAILRKNLNSPDEVRSFDKGKLELVKLGDITVGRGTFEPGWKWSECIKPIAGTESCQSSHLGYMLAGRMRIVMDDGSQLESAPGDAFQIAPGHDAWVIGNEACVMLDFSGYENYAKAK